MKFFTPELFRDFNSPDDEIADRADAEWEAAIARYRLHLEQLADRLPAPVKMLAGLCLHDAELLEPAEPIERFIAHPVGPLPLLCGLGIVAVRQADRATSLNYLLWDRVRKHPPETPWTFSGLRPHWLYDGVDAAPEGRDRFFHRILLSDGTILEIPFASVVVHEIPLPETREDEAARQIA